MHNENIALHRFVLFTAFCITFLIFVGGLVTSNAVTVWTAKAVIPTTAHVLTGALVVGTSFLLTFLTYATVAIDNIPDFRSAA
jgi:hypothetical protein